MLLIYIHVPVILNNSITTNRVMLCKMFVLNCVSYISKEAIPAADAYIGLAPPGNAGSWQRENKVI